MSVLTTQSNNTHIQAVDSKLMPYAPSYIGPQNNPDEPNTSFSDILNILKRRKWSIIIPLLIILFLVTYYTLSTPPSFRANATIQIEREGAEIVDFGRTQNRVTSYDLNDPFFRTRYEMLRGRVIAQKVINDLSLQESLSPTKQTKPKSFSSKIFNIFSSKKVCIYK